MERGAGRGGRGKGGIELGRDKGKGVGEWGGGEGE